MTISWAIFDAELAAELIYQLIKQKPNAVICLALGEFPMRAYKLLLKNFLRISKFLYKPFALWDWMGIPLEDTGSCVWFFHTYIIEPLGLKTEQFTFFDGLTNNYESKCQPMDNFIKADDGIGLMAVGVGLNGYIGFNEPGVSP